MKDIDPTEGLRMTYTTGQVAKICTVAPRTVSNWFNNGQLKGHRIPGGKDRRIPRLSLIQFLRDEGMDIGKLEVLGDNYRVLYIGNDEKFEEELCRHGPRRAAPPRARDAVQAATQTLPMCVVIDWSLPENEAGKAAGLINLQEPYKGLAATIGLITQHTKRSGYGWDALDYSFETVEDAAIDYASLAEIIEDHIRKKYFEGK